MTTRLTEIKTWVSSLLPNLQSIEPIQSDASARKYFRVCVNNDQYILMDTEPNEELLRFVQVAQLLKGRITVPTIIQQDLDRGLLLLTDFGDQTYLSVLQDANEQQIDELYQDALQALSELQLIPARLPAMDLAYIQRNLSVFQEWYLQRHLQIEVDTNLIIQLQELFVNIFTMQPQVLVHVDYHSRNLMVIQDHNPGILDFQDAMLGPITYDLVSLLQDAYITWPRSKVEAWIKSFSQYAGIEFNTKLLRDFDMVGLQRHLKNLGVFARLNYRDNKPNYLESIPTLINYVIKTCDRYPELSQLLDYFKENILVEDL